MRKLYLVRHGLVDFPEGVQRCIGRTDYPLSKAGREQAKSLAEYFQNHPVEKLYTSPLIRSRETAEMIAGDTYTLNVEKGLMELGMGEWEDIPLAQIKKELESEPLYGEGRTRGSERFHTTVQKILHETKGDVICVAHAGVNCCYLAQILGIPLEVSRSLPQPYGGFSILLVEGEDICRIATLGQMPKEAPSKKECERLWNKYHTPSEVRRHCEKVCEVSLKLANALKDKGIFLNMDLIQAGALLHDIARAEESHAERGTRWMIKEGYPRVAELIRQHHDLVTISDVPDETQIVYLADKMVKGTQIVSVEERFMESRQKCLKQEEMKNALSACKRRYKETMLVQQKIGYIVSNTCIGK